MDSSNLSCRFGGRERLLDRGRGQALLLVRMLSWESLANGETALDGDLGTVSDVGKVLRVGWRQKVHVVKAWLKSYLPLMTANKGGAICTCLSLLTSWSRSSCTCPSSSRWVVSTLSWLARLLGRMLSLVEYCGWVHTSEGFILNHWIAYLHGGRCFVKFMVWLRVEVK